jgi:hypothetical protein
MRFHGLLPIAASLMLNDSIPVIVAGMLGHSLAILMIRHAHLTRFARYPRFALLEERAIFQGPRMKQLA